MNNLQIENNINNKNVANSYGYKDLEVILLSLVILAKIIAVVISVFDISDDDSGWDFETMFAIVILPIFLVIVSLTSIPLIVKRKKNNLNLGPQIRTILFATIISILTFASMQFGPMRGDQFWFITIIDLLLTLAFFFIESFKQKRAGNN